MIKGFHIASWMAMLLGAPAWAGSYDAAPLRTNIGLEPYFRTEEGRTGKRFSEGELNRYRLYDFYRRQAEHHLQEGRQATTLLPPYPGLDGGRRGHWGATNEKGSSHAVREAGPAFTRVTSRGGSGEMLYRPAGKNHAALMAIDTLKPGLRRFYPTAQLITEEHPFGLAVDRFGIRLRIDGSPALLGAEHEWTRGGNAIATWRGYEWHGEDTAFLWEVDGKRLTDFPSLVSSADASLTALMRRLVFQEDIATDVQFHLPRPSASGMETWQTTIGRHDDAVIIRQHDAENAWIHRIDNVGTLRCEASKDGNSVILHDIRANDQLRVVSWTGKLVGRENAIQWMQGMDALTKNPALPAKTAVKEFADETLVKGRINADPEASGGSYEIDDIPVPIVNPDRAPMTLSGVDFDQTGIAYLCTLMGDVWRVSGLTGDLAEVRWKRFAAGLDMPMGLVVVDGAPHVLVRHHLIRLTDRDGNGEADLYERINHMILPSNCENGRDLRCDRAGNFYFNTSGGIDRLSADGKKLEQIGMGARNPLGLGLRDDGLVLSDSSEGNLENGTCTIFESNHPENVRTIAKRKRLLYLPRGIDNSPGSRLFLNDERFGPWGRSILAVSFGTGGWYTMLRDVAQGTPQAMLIPQPGLFGSGACRVAQNPVDGQVFVAGLDGWGDYGITEGCLHRIRYTGKKSTTITAWRAHRNGIWLSFDAPLGPPPTAARCFVQQWNYIDSPQTYGSAEYSVKSPETLGHDRLHVEKVISLDGKHALFIEISDLLPSMCLHLHLTLTDDKGRDLPIDVYATVQQLHPDAPWGKATPPQRPAALAVPTVVNNGDTYQKILEHFDRLAGREIQNRAVTADISYRKEDLNYAWIRKNLLETHCLMCHGPGTQHDYSSYDGIMSKISKNDARQSMLHGMMQSGSMPPYPLPRISPSMQQAVADWIQMGAPR